MFGVVWQGTGTETVHEKALLFVAVKAVPGFDPA